MCSQLGGQAHAQSGRGDSPEGGREDDVDAQRQKKKRNRRMRLPKDFDWNDV
ncbi:hypothetical protein COCSUDRAFT_61570 [Coccomyxa subellipsoidea C-169]|uniref:Signal recognition particle SRP72 subunit RNA-binding domain-containing protein n=1 Tax=Coccomyxa subellipsoidea (strain C-169) TaxID=574566 RepID=I0Z3X9_COCSC|nr:hypothetical protein COCSUDRAFT_61570 [Coccomyxa subellipsoidea C-169]EIE25348.1 hypothetical protein COCSUDRAFT_61570 [Coccomyxa subellipsoidea C-169]|eukprot:XP_005649892.1 hypothetical protein COCSUDRAFT_61570 [Coccomyxa subellipsoidea C-169]